MKQAARRIINVITYGNPEGHPNFLGKPTYEFDEFLAEVFSKDWYAEKENN